MLSFLCQLTMVFLFQLLFISLLLLCLLIKMIQTFTKIKFFFPFNFSLRDKNLLNFFLNVYLKLYKELLFSKMLKNINIKSFIKRCNLNLKTLNIMRSTNCTKFNKSNTKKIFILLIMAYLNYILFTDFYKLKRKFFLIMRLISVLRVPHKISRRNIYYKVKITQCVFLLLQHRKEPF